MVKNKLDCVGKWGHSAIVFKRQVNKVMFCNDTCLSEDLTTSLAGQIIPMLTSEPEPPRRYTGRIQIGDQFKTIAVYPDKCGACTSDANRYYEGNVIPAIYLLAGDSAGVFKSRDVFRSSGGCECIKRKRTKILMGDVVVHCETDGYLCSEMGACSR